MRSLDTPFSKFEERSEPRFGDRMRSMELFLIPKGDVGLLPTQYRAPPVNVPYYTLGSISSPSSKVIA